MKNKTKILNKSESFIILEVKTSEKGGYSVNFSIR